MVSNALFEAKNGGSLEAAAVTPRTLKLLFPHNSIGVVIRLRCYRDHAGSDRAPARAHSCLGRRPEVSDMSDNRPLPYAQVMGRGGTFIKELMSTTAASVRVSQPHELISATQERIITISGQVAAVDAAQDAICARMAAAPATQQLRETDYSVLKFATPMGCGACGPPMAAIGGSYPAVGMGMGGGSPMMRPPPPGPGGAPGTLNYKQFIATLPDSISPEMAQHQFGEYVGRQQAAAQRVPAQTGADASGAPLVEERMPLPDKIVSGIIGKGGSVIKEIIQRSGALIKVSQKTTENYNGERIVSISGDARAVANAQLLISERCHQIEAQLQQAKAGGGQAAGAGAPAQQQAYAGQQPGYPQQYAYPGQAQYAAAGGQMGAAGAQCAGGDPSAYGMAAAAMGGPFSCAYPSHPPQW